MLSATIVRTELNIAPYVIVAISLVSIVNKATRDVLFAIWVGRVVPTAVEELYDVAPVKMEK